MSPIDELKYIRFKQRLTNFEDAYAQFIDALKKDTVNDAGNRSSLIHTFEFTFELAWKTLKDLLEAKETTEVTFPREVLQAAYDHKYITETVIWGEALKKRNEAAHTYDEVIAVEVEKFIREKFAPVLEQLRNFFNKVL